MPTNDRRRRFSIAATLAGAGMLVLPAAPALAQTTTTGPPADGPAAATSTQEPAAIGDRPLLRLGDRGQAVAAWQRQMILLTGADLTVDGIYGTTTEQATSQFQAFLGLRVDGIVGENTRSVMRYLLANTRDYTPLEKYVDFELAGYTSEQGYCIEVLAGDDWNVECGPLPPYPVSAQTIALDSGGMVLLGAAEPTIARVTVETTSGSTVDAQLETSVNGIPDSIWSTNIAPGDVYAVHALAADGSEVRAIVIQDGESIQILERGDRGQAVAEWQGKLNRLLLLDLATDGIFGETTVQTTTALQSFFGLTADGIVGPNTRALVDYLLGATGR